MQDIVGDYPVIRSVEKIALGYQLTCYVFLLLFIVRTLSPILSHFKTCKMGSHRNKYYFLYIIFQHATVILRNFDSVRYVLRKRTDRERLYTRPFIKEA